MKILFLVLVPVYTYGQIDTSAIYRSIDTFYQNQADIQLSELKQTSRFRWLAYMPHPGYSPFTGGFTVNLNLAAPLQEIRLQHTTRQKQQAIVRQNLFEANQQKAHLKTEYQKLQLQIELFDSQNTLDSLNTLLFQLAVRKYENNDITPTEFLTIQKNREEYLLIRRRQAVAIQESILLLAEKAKMQIHK